jgi:hypothetical protein
MRYSRRARFMSQEEAKFAHRTLARVLIDRTLVPPGPDSLREFVVAIVKDQAAPMLVRNACHLLMIAIERNDACLVESSFLDLHRVAELQSYQLPPL